ncbi:hypothetical protein M501DRAFT_994802 [Patellaria atrata CBS 101060]|uniref:Uncharacterized protein n=1 Tax=Patellaria atrata CBS 101060 TaxID=1346257 RepID=A0A9P4SIV9_9PEZI|nr:hypothetical protein M501DRAFT_994802 [Patellaria atrata CBS 101060]
MEALKSVINPGHGKDDDILYGTGENTASNPATSANTGKLEGEGSHLGRKEPGGTDTTYGTDSGLSSRGPNLNTVDNTRDDTRHELSSGQPEPISQNPEIRQHETSRNPLAGSSTTDTNPESRQKGTSSTSTGIADSFPGNHDDTYRDQAADTSGTTSTTERKGGIIGSIKRLVGNKDQSSDKENRPHVVSEEASSASIKSGVVGQPTDEKLSGPPTAGRVSETSKPLPDTPSQSQHGISSLPDRSVGSDRGVSDTHDHAHHHDRDPGMTTGAGVGAGAATLAAKRAYDHREHDQTTSDPSTSGSANVGPTETSRSFPLGSGHKNPDHFREHTRDHTSSDIPSGTTGSSPRSTVIPGPHSTDTANRLDPNIDSSTYTGGSHYSGHHSGTISDHPTSTTDTSHTGQDHHSRDTTIAGAGATGAAELSEGRNHHDEPTSRDESAKTSSTGPHKSSLLNKLDPRVHSDLSKPKEHSTIESTSNPYSASPVDPRVDGGSRSTTGPESTRSSDHHYGRDAALGAGTGATGLGAYEANKHRGEDTSNLPAETGHSTRDLPSSTDNPIRAVEQHSAPSYEDQRASAPVGSSILGASRPTEHQSDRDTVSPTGTDAYSGIDARYMSSVRRGSRMETEDGAFGSIRDSSSPTATHSRHQDTLGRYNDQRASPTTPSPTSGATTSDPSHREHHHGRDVDVGAGAGAAGLGAYEAGKHHHGQQGTQDPTTTDELPTATSNLPISTSGYDQATKHVREPTSISGTQEPGLTYEKPHSTTGYGDQTNKPPKHHHGRDAALGAEVGAAGLDAYEAGKHHHGNQGTQDPTTSSTLPSTTSDQPISTSGYDQAPRHQREPTDISGSHGATSTKFHEQPSATGPSDQTSQLKEHHYGRDAAIAGGAGAAGTGAYQAYHPHRDAPPNDYDYSGQGVRDPTAGAHHPIRDETTSRQTAGETTDESHKGRNAAVAGCAAAAGAGAYAYSQHDQEKMEKERLKQERAHEKELEKEQRAHEKEVAKEEHAAQKAHDKEVAKEQKAHDKEVAKEQHAAQKAHDKEVAKEKKAHDKEVAKEQKAHDKQVAREQKAHDKQVAKEEKAHEKEIAKEQHAAQKAHEKQHEYEEKERQKKLARQEEEREQDDHSPTKKKGGLFGFLHRNKNKENTDPATDDPTSPITADRTDPATGDPTSSTTADRTDSRTTHGAETAAAAGTAGGPAAAAYANYSDQNKHHKLHKDPPEGYYEQKMAEQGGIGPEERVARTDPAVGSTVGGAGEFGHKHEYRGVPTTTDPSAHNTHSPPSTSNPASHHGTGYTADQPLAGPPSHGYETQPGTSTTTTTTTTTGVTTGSKGVLPTESRTGLPIDTSLGDGRGGTDGNETIQGYGHSSQPGTAL